MIVDAHNHIFPFLGGPAGFESADEHRQFLQLYIAKHGEPVHRLRDHAVVPEAEQALHDGVLQGPEGLKASANFRVGKYGRFEWDYLGETYYRSFLPPSLQDMTTPVEFILQQMARAGVDCAVLQNARLYGRLNVEFSQAMKQHPGKFIGLADVVEHRAHEPEEIDRLTHAIKELGLRGIYYASRGHFVERYAHGFDDPRYDPYWETVRSLGIPVFWEIQGVPTPTPANYLREIERLNQWCERYPDIPCVLTHGISPDYLQGATPDPIARLLGRDQMMVEILYPIHWGRNHDYPYAELAPVLKQLINLTGASRLVWGSDMPNVERNCTFRQSLDYLKHGLNGIVTEREAEGIFGQNVLSVFGENAGR